MKRDSIAAVLVAYKPIQAEIEKTVSSICKQVDKLYIIDNTPTAIIKHFYIGFIEPNIVVKYLGDNKGIASAQNIGIEMAKGAHFEFVLLTDQDTEYPHDYVEKMLEGYRRLMRERKNIAAIAPTYRDTNRNYKKQAFVKFEHGILRRNYFENGWHNVSHTISSGQIIPIRILEIVGTMNEQYFIDWVDTEWCWRAEIMKYYTFQSADIAIKHCLGESSRRFLNREITLHSPERNYYIIRNAISLIKSDWVATGNKQYLFIQICKDLIMYCLFSKNKRKQLLYMSRGMWDGIMGHLGLMNR
jgi:rhamnosyltransferase